MILTFEELFVLGSVKIECTQSDIDNLNNLLPDIKDWDSVLRISIGSGIAPLIYKKISKLSNRYLIPDNVVELFAESYFVTLRRSMIMHYQFERIIARFQENNLSVLALKGIFLSEWLYEDIGLRQFSDIDLLISAKDGLKCIDLLKEMGFVPKDYNPVSEFIQSKSDIVHFPPMVNKLVSVELHTKLHQDCKEYNISIESCWESATCYKIRDKNVFGLHLYDLIIHVCTHLDRHFQEGQLQFTCFNDVANLLNKHGGLLDWNAFILRCREFRVELIVMKYFILVHRYFNVKLDDKIVIKYSDLLEDEDVELFLKYLHGYRIKTEEKTLIPVHLRNLNKLGSSTEYCKYLFHLIFPTRNFMIKKYKIKYQKLFWLYYPYRYWVGLKGLIILIKQKTFLTDKTE